MAGPNINYNKEGGGMNPYLMMGAGSAVSGIADYLGGSEERDYVRELRELQKRFYSMLEHEKDQPGITDQDVMSAGSTVRTAMQPNINRFAESFRQRLGGTDSGQFKGALGQYGMESIADRLMALKTKQIGFNAERPLRIMSMMGRTGAGRMS